MELIRPLFLIFLLSVVTSVISVTLARGLIFEDLRNWVVDKSKFFGTLITCPFCTSFWVAFVLIGVYRPIVTHSGFYPIDLIVTYFLVVGSSSWVTPKMF